MYLPLKHSTFLILLTILLSSTTYAQLAFTKTDSVKVKENNEWLKNAWAGGISYAQFSEIDVDLDGKKDLFCFDRSGDKVSIFINAGISDYISSRIYMK